MPEQVTRFVVALDSRMLAELMSGSASASEEEAVEMLITTALTATGKVKATSELIRALGKVKVSKVP